MMNSFMPILLSAGTLGDKLGVAFCIFLCACGVLAFLGRSLDGKKMNKTDGGGKSGGGERRSSDDDDE